MKRKCLDTSTCPIARTLDVIGDWWSLLIVRDAFLGKRRFGEFQKSLGLAKNILCIRLQKLVSHEILETGPASDGSAYQEYRLTEKGRSLYLVLVALRQWGNATCLKKGSWTCCWWTGKPASRSSPWNCGRRTDACWGRRTSVRSTHRIGDAGQKRGALMVHLLVVGNLWSLRPYFAKGNRVQQ